MKDTRFLEPIYRNFVSNLVPITTLNRSMLTRRSIAHQKARFTRYTMVYKLYGISFKCPRNRLFFEMHPNFGVRKKSMFAYFLACSDLIAYQDLYYNESQRYKLSNGTIVEAHSFKTYLKTEYFCQQNSQKMHVSYENSHIFEVSGTILVFF